MKDEIKYKKPRKYLESKLQQECLKFFKLQYRYLCYNFENEKGQIKTYAPLIKNCNEGNKSDIKRMIEYAEGLTPGVADMSLKLANKKYNGLEIEFKKLGEKQRASQIAYQKMIEKNNYKYILIDCFEDFKTEIEKYIK